MKIKKEYEFSHKRQIWRILPSDAGKLIIEERDIQKREAYFNCVDIRSGKKIFENLQLDEKFWIGIEGVYNDIIFFHKYQKPDMPVHKGIISFDVNSASILWQNPDHNFLFISEEILYTYRSFFEGKKFYALNYLSGEVIKELGSDESEIKKIRENKIIDLQDEYIFPEYFDESLSTIHPLPEDIRKGLPGKIQAAKYSGVLLFNALEQAKKETTQNIFKAVDLSSGRVILSEVLNRETGRFIPDSFFIKGNLLFLLKERDLLVVYSIKQ